MASLVIPRREIRTNQPASSEVDWSNPLICRLASDAYLITAQNTGWMNLAGGAVDKSPVIVGSVTVSPRSLFIGQKTAGGGKHGRSFSGPPKELLSFTFAVVVQFDSVAGLQVITGNDDSNYGGVQLQHSDGALQITHIGVANVAIGPTLAAGIPYSIVISRNHGNQTINYAVCDLSSGSFQKGSLSDTAGFLPPTQGVYPVGYGRDVSESVNGCIAQVVISGSWLSLSETERFAQNPRQIFAQRESRLFVPVGGGGTTTVTRDSTAAYKVQGSIQASSVAAYGIRSAIQSDSAVSYAIRASAQNDAASSYTVRGSIQQSSAAAAYLIRGLVDQVIAASYAVRGAVSSDASATYNILSASSVSASASAGYNIRGNVNQDVAASYLLRESVTQDTSASYSILSASSVSSSVTAGYAIKGSVQSSIVAGYSIAQAVQAEIAASYIVRSGAVSEAQVAYVIRGLVQQSIAASYAIDGAAFTGSISDADITRIVQAVLAALNATAIPVNIKQVNSITIKGAGVTGNTWGPL